MFDEKEKYSIKNNGEFRIGTSHTTGSSNTCGLGVTATSKNIHIRSVSSGNIKQTTNMPKKENIKFDFNDVSLIPTVLSNVVSRDEITVLDENNKLPIYIAPMDTVIDEYNYDEFIKQGFIVCIPRCVNITKKKFPDECFISFGLDELEDIVNFNGVLPDRVLIDVANAHSVRVFNLAKKIKENYPIELMVGNVALPATFKLYAEIGADYVRCGIGGGHACTTSANTAIHYPMASLVLECFEIKDVENYKTKIIADGGFKNYDDVIKAIALGADGVMIGTIANKSLESCGQNYEMTDFGRYNEINMITAVESFNAGRDVYKLYRGMSTKDVQRTWGKEILRTSEGITKYNRVEYTIEGWKNNFVDYIKTTMSYLGKFNITEFRGNADYVFITQNAFKRYHK